MKINQDNKRNTYARVYQQNCLGFTKRWFWIK